MNPTERTGSAAIEFALTLPLFVLLVTAIFEFGWMFFMRSTVIHAVRDGCRAGAVIPPGESPSASEVAQGQMTAFMAGYSIDCRGDTTRCGITISTEGESGARFLGASWPTNLGQSFCHGWMLSLTSKGRTREARGANSTY